MDVFDIQRRIREATDGMANGFVLTRYSGGVIEAAFPSYGEHSAESVVSEILGRYSYTIEDFVEAVEEELGGKYLYQVGIDHTGLDQYSVIVHYHDDPADTAVHSLVTDLYPCGEFDTDNPQAKDLIESVLDNN